MDGVALRRKDDGQLRGFEFLSIEDASEDFDAETVYALELRQRVYGDEWEFTALHSPEWNNVLLSGNQHLSEDEYIEQAVASFCYFSVILMNPDDQ